MAKKLPVFTYEKLVYLIDDANEAKTVSAVIILAIDTFSKKCISALQYAALLDLAAERMYAIYGNRI